MITLSFHTVYKACLFFEKLFFLLFSTRVLEKKEIENRTKGATVLFLLISFSSTKYASYFPG